MKIRYLEPHELSPLKNAASDRYKFMITLAFNHGLRISETLSLTPAHFQGGYMIIQRLKGSEKTVQKLLPEEVEMLKAYKIGPDEKLFPITRQAAWKMMKTLGKRTDVPLHKCTNHALKHTTAIIGLRGKMTLPEIQTRLGHKSGNSTMMYLRVNDAVADDAWGKVVTC